ncbi:MULTISPECIES: biotin carboxylase N-terminal domain-containing protein [unclassified Limnobacter]|uniref:acetyl/propionyl/methylcrotonyl-CoA carboxylase subunit alpha n=1 Tax=unclassified Limnobacter TaxID=2630203 RepID=UPI000C55643F|nr:MULTISPECIES: biotin carboxylase N-terminal domain-containing protein [unclassified Limnobacter]MAZ10792.1 3-methylcrotonyl-CoA carboxylase [Sutterellaceae bacterium]|tara:strand:- start:4739 stop:6727 length:1989 start_codon:yes stop_codon:yes gene_type:complete
MPRIKKLLIANRNEIARRILRAAKPMGIATVAVYSEADEKAMHVQEADEAYCIGPAPSLESYLRIDKLIETALKAGADAIHPGYGFVSESPAFAQACAQAGITLVGPTPQAIADMADKACAKEIAQQAGLPCIPGFSEPNASVSDLMAAAQRIGYPVMIKALAGGGGRGMRLVMNESEFASQLHSAQLEAKNAFNDDRVMLEKAIINPRHIEIQVLADTHGHAVHLGERDCSVQRRHQKIVEEAPSPAVSAELRARMGEAALKLVRATSYVGAGTVEFLLDANGDFYFIEMNTRLQVEHGVTEAITGIDLVQWQLRIASGEHLTLQQDNITFFGHAIQGRLCAEDPARDFMPQTGPVLAWRPDENSRCDHALQEGGEVSPWYDSLLAKVIVHGENRLAACEKLADSLKRTVLIGFEHNALYLQRIASHPVFQGGDFGTGFLAQHADELLKPQHFMAECAVAAVFLAYAQQQNHAAWPTPLTGFSSTRALPRPLKLKVQGKSLNLKVSSNNNSYEVDGLGDEAVVLEHWQCMTTQQGSVTIQSMVNDQSAQYTVTQSNSGVWVQQGLNPQALHVDDETLLGASALAEGVFQAVVSSPMNGKVTQVLVQPGQQVEAGTVLVCLEAMKMEHRISAKTAAIVEQVHIKVGDQMKQKQAMVQLSPIH